MPVAVNYDTQTEDLNTNLYPGAKFTGEQKSNKQKYMGKDHFFTLKCFNKGSCKNFSNFFLFLFPACSHFPGSYESTGVGIF